MGETRGERDPRSPGTEQRKNPGSGSRAGAPVSQSCPSLCVLFLPLSLPFSSSGFTLEAFFQASAPFAQIISPTPSGALGTLGAPLSLWRLEVHSTICYAPGSYAGKERAGTKSEREEGVLCVHGVCVWVGGKEVQFPPKYRGPWTNSRTQSLKMIWPKPFNVAPPVSGCPYSAHLPEK